MSKRIKVLIFASTANLGGAEKTVFHLSKGFDRDKIDLTVCFLYGEGIVSQRLRNENVNVVILRHDIESFLKTTARFYNMVKENRYDILYLWGYKVNIIGRIIGKFFGCKIITAQRSVDDHRTKLQDSFDNLTTWMSDLFISNSKAAEDMLVNRKGIDRIKTLTLYNGIDIENFSVENTTLKSDLGIDDTTKVIGVVANLIYYKGHEYFLKSLSILKSSGIKVCAILVGEGEYRRTLENLARELRISEIVHFIGQRKDVPTVLSCIDVFVLPSLFEGMPNAVMEAMASRKPVVATSVGGVPELVIEGETGYLVPPKQPEIMAEKIKSILEDSQKAAAMGEKAYTRVINEFTMRKMIESTEEIFAKLVHEKIS